jgi:replicative DNA helicase
MSTAKTPKQQLPVAKKIYSELPHQILMPKNIAMEESILGQILLDKSAFKIANRVLDSDSFYKGPHVTVWKACVALNKKTQPIDLLTVTEQIRKSGLLGEASKLQGKKLSVTESRKRTKLLKFGITPFGLVELTNRVASAANLEYHCRILYQFQLRRNALEEAELVKQKALDMTEDIFETYDSVAKSFRSKNPQNVLTYKSMNQTMIDGAKEPLAKRLCGSLLHENTLAIIFAGAGTGKTIFSTQVGDVLSRGTNLFGNKDFYNSAKEKKVLLFDFEMEESEVFQRYKRGDSNAEVDGFEWHDNFFRCGINPNFIDFEDADTLITNEIQLQIEEQKPDIVILDNITYISSESSDTKMATKTMKKLLAIQKTSGNNLSIIVIAHTPKRDPSLPIELRHLAGAAAFANFAKNIIAISKSKLDPSMRYLKQLKNRQDVEMYQEENVIVCGVNKSDSGRLEYEFLKYGREADHLMTPDFKEQEFDVLTDCLTRHKKGESWRSLADHVKMEYGITMTHTTVMRKVKEFAFNELTGKSELDDSESPKPKASKARKNK